ncbi:MAG TPA: hypothetical protein VHW09_15990 [Bryobacteraceae bacterium]|jgi:hypothetical protein|nr:hypothetical protein [Bryobacteraceae bacterium]
MRKLLFALAVVPAAFAQAPTVPPPIVQIACSPGYAAGPSKPYASARAAIDAVGLSSATGAPQTWTIELHNNFASIEDLDKAIAAAGMAPAPRDAYGQSQDDLLLPPRTMLAVFQPELSYRPDEAIRLLPKARYMSITINRIRVGLEGDFEQLVRLRKLTNDSINLNRPELAYRVISGAPTGVYLSIAPIATLRSFDDGVADLPAFAAPVADERAKTAPKQAEIEIGREHLLFRVEPRLSYVSDDFAAIDEPFWRGKPPAQN